MGVGLGTLLGPEASVAALHPFGVGGLQPASVRTRSATSRGWSCYRPCVENFTVDASIFVVTTSY